LRPSESFINMGSSVRFQQILGIRFIVGNPRDAIDQVSREGGLVVMPAAPALINLAHDKQYREALLNADFALADSSLMVAVWNFIQGDKIPKLSGLRYLRAFLERPEFRETGASFWIMPTQSSAQRDVSWLADNGIQLEEPDVYVAPMYGSAIYGSATHGAAIEDEELLRRLEERRPRHIVLGLGGGTQERLGLYLKRNLSYKPTIHCIGAAIAFLSGDQVQIPVWVDHAGLGWLWRSVSKPSIFVPRYWAARSLAPMILRYRDRLPSMASGSGSLHASLPAER
jgi:N-acetylglucosaminyldiphosphoundecaprenol N-acetyl-beta-D-mannosaminyltransferase